MKLLARSTRSHLLLATVTLLIAIPVLYLSVQSIVREDVDESLLVHKQELMIRMRKDSSVSPLSIYGFDGISPINGVTAKDKDQFYTTILYDSISNENIPYRVLKSQLSLHGKRYQVQFKRSLIDGEDLIENIIMVIIIILALIVSGMIIINRLSSRRLWTPFYTTIGELRRYEIEKNEPIPFPSTKIDEFNDLHASLQSLVARSQQTFQSQKAFTENASHEIQTPLAIFQGKLELLMQTTPLTPEQAILISDLADASQRMNHLNKNLLLLTRIENQQFYEKQPLSITAILGRLVELYQPQADQKHITTHFHLQHDVTIQADPTLIDILFSNLLSNAIRHNHDNGSIEILLQGTNSILVRNTGRATALNSDKFFARFQKDSSDLNSLGLGLAICRTICEVNGYKLQYEFREGLHSFQVTF